MRNSKHNEVSVVIPAYNEEKRILPSLSQVIPWLAECFHDFEIIVVDDGSRDATLQVVASVNCPKLRVLKNERNMGKGYSVLRGMASARMPLVLFTDSDLSTPIGELDAFLRYVDEGYDVVIASRRKPESRIKVLQPWYRQAMGKLFPLMVNFIVLPGFRDTQCGFKLFRKRVLDAILPRQRLTGFAFDVELLFLARKFGYRIKEAGVVWVDVRGSKVSCVRDSLKMFRDIVRIRLADLSGHYSVAGTHGKVIS